MTDPKSKTGDKGQKPKPSGLLYHYTDQRGLLGILEDGSIRATHILYLNDASELIASWPVLLERVKSAVIQSKSVQREEIDRIFGTLLDEMWCHPRNRSIYVWCLTDDGAATPLGTSAPGDRLSQWRAYSHNGNGYSLGFDLSMLRESFGPLRDSLGLNFNSGPCEYNQASGSKRLSAIADMYLEGLLPMYEDLMEMHNPKFPIEDAIEQHHNLFSLSEMYLNFMRTASYVKPPGFSEEKEWRFVFVTENEKETMFRESRFGLTPYISVNLELARVSSPLKRIIVGPCAHKEQALEAVKMLLWKKGIEGVDVEPSNIPYRNW